MTAKQLGIYATDGARYGTFTDGNGTLLTITGNISAGSKPYRNSQAPDGSTYFTLTNGSGTLV